MREDTPNWFSKWDERLPSPEELMPLSQTLISPDLAIAFNIRNTSEQPQLFPPSSNPLPSSRANTGHPQFADSMELGSGSAGEEPARTLKRPRLVWTPQLHKRFVDAVAHLGIKNAVPKTIMQLMSVDGLTRENVASHLQKYRLYLKRMQGLSVAGGGVGVSADPATDNLFASSPVPPHFLPFVPVQALQQQQQQQMAVVAGHPQYHRQVGHFEVPFLSRQSQSFHVMGTSVHNQVVAGYAEDMESAIASGGRKVLTLFPAGDD